ncbi:MAG: lipoprotein-releasing system permease protein [Limisphaerales bacterium]|jgi:lipoprotein-releasing system permease protein
MTRALTLELAWRLMTHSTNGFARFVTWVSFVGLALGVTILTMVVTVMNGFDAELKSRLLSTLPHITVDQAQVSDELKLEVGKHPEVASVADYFQGLGAVISGPRMYPVTLYGLDGSSTKLGGLAGLTAESVNKLMDDRMGIALGVPLARALGVSVGEELSLISVEVDGNAVLPKVYKFRLVDTFSLGAEPDYTLALLNLSRFESETWAAMGELGIQIQLRDALQANAVIAQFQATRPKTKFTSWQSRYGELFRAVQLEKSMMFVLLALVVGVAGFNIMAGQSMMVNDKKQTIAILRTMGCSARLIGGVFFVQGGIISVVGTLLGLVLGIWAAFSVNEILDVVEAVSGMHLLDGSLFVEVPVKVLATDVVFIAAMSLGLCCLSALLPAKRAAAMDPVAALH